MEINNSFGGVVIYGIGLEGEKFFWKTKGELNIAYAIDQQTDKNFHGLDVYDIAYAMDNCPKFPIIVTVQIGIYKEIKSVLKSYGLTEYVDFIHYEGFGKKLAIIYGNCHMVVLAQYLKSNPYFCSQYYIRNIYVVEEQPTQEELMACKLLITQDIMEKNKLKVYSANKLIRSVNKECIKIIVPNLYGYNLFFPQIYESIEWKKHLNEDKANDKEYLKVVANNAIPDENIKRLWKEGYDVEHIIDFIKNADVYSREDIIENFNRQINKLKKREQNCDVILSDFIEENYQYKKLFYEPYHPTNDILYEMGRRICKLLNMQIDEKYINTLRFDQQEAFIYGCVCRALDIKFEETYVRYVPQYNTLENRPINLKEYVKQSIAWLYMNE